MNANTRVNINHWSLQEKRWWQGAKTPLVVLPGTLLLEGSRHLTAVILPLEPLVLPSRGGIGVPYFALKLNHLPNGNSFGSINDPLYRSTLDAKHHCSVGWFKRQLR